MSSSTIHKRLDHLDLLKFLSIFSVIFFHCLTVSINFQSHKLSAYLTYFSISCLSVSIPTFFLINGRLLFNKPFLLKKHFKKIMHLIIIVIIWDFFNVFIKGTFLYHETAFKDLLHHMWAFDAGWSNQLWFLMSLFILYLFFPIFKVAYDLKKGYLFFFFVIAFCLIFGNSTLLLLLRIAEVILNIPFTNSDVNFFNQFNPFRGIYGFTFIYFLLGAFCLPLEKLKQTKAKFCISLSIFLISILLLTSYGVFCSLYSGTYFDTVWGGFDTLFTFIGTICLFFCSLTYHAPANIIGTFIQFISKNTLGIYLLQSILSDFARSFLSFLGYTDNIFIDLICSFLLLCLCAILIYLLKKLPIISKIIIL